MQMKVGLTSLNIINMHQWIWLMI